MHLAATTTFQTLPHPASAQLSNFCLFNVLFLLLFIESLKYFEVCVLKKSLTSYKMGKTAQGQSKPTNKQKTRD